MRAVPTNGARIFLVSLLLMVGDSGKRLTAQTLDEARIAGIVCGPQCTKRVLDHYKIVTSLDELVQEMQGPHLEQGTTLADITAALTRRGVHVCAVSVPGDVPVQWPHPVLIHFPRADAGHFAVLLPPEGHDRVILWSSRAEPLEYPATTCFSARTNIVLLTAPHIIVESDVRMLGGVPYVFQMVTVIPLLLLGVTVFLVGWARMARKTNSSRKESES